MEPKTFITFVHLLGLVTAIGSVIFLDCHALRFLRGRRVRYSDIEHIELGMKLVTAGLALLWASGVAFLVLYWISAPELLANPKLHAKLAIVVVLTLNGAVLHRHVLPLVRGRVGGPLFRGMTGRQRRLIILSTAVSFCSWQTAFILGVAREFNFTVAALWLLAGYGVVVLAAAVALHTLIRVLTREETDGANAFCFASADDLRASVE